MNLYVMNTEFPEEKIVIKGIRKPMKVSLLGFDGKVQSKKSGDSVSISIPPFCPGTYPCEYARVLKLEDIIKN